MNDSKSSWRLDNNNVPNRGIELSIPFVRAKQLRVMPIWTFDDAGMDHRSHYHGIHGSYFHLRTNHHHIDFGTAYFVPVLVVYQYWDDSHRSHIVPPNTMWLMSCAYRC